MAAYPYPSDQEGDSCNQHHPPSDFPCLPPISSHYPPRHRPVLPMRPVSRRQPQGPGPLMQPPSLRPIAMMHPPMVRGVPPASFQSSPTRMHHMPTMSQRGGMPQRVMQPRGMLEPYRGEATPFYTQMYAAYPPPHSPHEHLFHSYEPPVPEFSPLSCFTDPAPEGYFDSLVDEPTELIVIPTSPGLSPKRPPSEAPDTDLLSAEDITDEDVLCGRGAGANTHPGNVTFRSLIGDYQYAYLSAKALAKANIAKSIVSHIRMTHGRFLKRSTEKGHDGKHFWYDIGNKAAREKTCQALRERGPSPYDLPVRSESSSSTAATESHIMLPGSEVNDNDVLLGRGGVTNSHHGNKIFRELVRLRQREYLAASKLKKAGVAKKIVEDIYEKGGRFLTDKNGSWTETTKEKAREKTSQALREKAPELRKVIKGAEGSTRGGRKRGQQDREKNREKGSKKQK